MSLIEVSFNPDQKQLRNFGRIAIIATALVGLLLYFIKHLPIKWVLILFAVGLAIFIISIVSLKLTRYIFVGLTLVTLPIGFVVSLVVLAAFYFLLITPVALIFRLIGRDSLNRRFDYGAGSYWQPHRRADKLDRYFQQF